MTDPLPAPLWAKLKAFLEAKNTGKVELDIQNGRVLAYKIVDCGRVDEGMSAPSLYPDPSALATGLRGRGQPW